jgi:HD-GYP domain-containing protein (c-di-GMP phosphodiesterase class II)
MVSSANHDPREAASMLGMVEALTTLVAARDQYTSRHSRDVGALATRIAIALGMTASEAQTLGQAGQLHDIGKVAIPDAILRKPGPLSPDEWTITRQHPAVSAEVVSYVPTLRHIAPIIRAHHERMDGSGYPDGLAGDEIPLGARILAVVDSYAAITTDRPYRSAKSPAWALAELRRGAGTQFDPNVVAALERVLAADPAFPSSRQLFEPYPATSQAAGD